MSHLSIILVWEKYTAKNDNNFFTGGSIIIDYWLVCWPEVSIGEQVMVNCSFNINMF